MSLVIEEWCPFAAATGDEPLSMVEPHLEALTEILRAVVYDGAGVSFVVPFSSEDAHKHLS